MPSSEVTTYLAPDCVMPFCKGCGHSLVLRKLNEALVSLQLPPTDVCLVTDIGCIGLADALFAAPHSVHTTHGRSTAFATGIALADAVLASNTLKTIVLIGDGGAMIGLVHLVNAALLNANVTVIVCNNFLFGMTGGQNSAFSPLEFITPTTPTGNIVPPLDICKVLAASHAGYIARVSATDKALTDTLAKAITRPGFSLVEVVALCTEHAAARNQLTGRGLQEIVIRHGQQLGEIVQRSDREPFDRAYRRKFPRSASQESSRFEDALAVSGMHALEHSISIVVAGSAGENVQSAAYRFCLAAIKQGLSCTQKSDNPVTQGSGFSIAEIVMSPKPVLFTGIEVPDALVVVSEDGLHEVAMHGLFERASDATQIVIDESLTLPSCKGIIHRQAFRTTGPKQAAATALAYLARLIGLEMRTPTPASR